MIIKKKSSSKLLGVANYPTRDSKKTKINKVLRHTFHLKIVFLKGSTVYLKVVKKLIKYLINTHFMVFFEQLRHIFPRHHLTNKC